MPTSPPRKRKTPAKKPAARKPAPNALGAEATGVELGFDFRGHRFVIDLATVDFGKAMFAMQVATRGGSITAQINLMVDSLEAALGQEQVATLYEVAPDLFSSTEAQKEFWEAFARISAGASVGESSAS